MTEHIHVYRPRTCLRAVSVMGSMCCPHMDRRVSTGRWTGPVVNRVVDPMMLHSTKPHFRDRIARQPHLHVPMQNSTTCTHR